MLVLILLPYTERKPSSDSDSAVSLFPSMCVYFLLLLVGKSCKESIYSLYLLHSFSSPQLPHLLLCLLLSSQSVTVHKVFFLCFFTFI